MRGLRLTTLSFCCALALAAPSAHASGSGGGAAYTEPGPVTLYTAPAGLVGRAKLFTGEAKPGRVIAVERYDELARQWAVLVRATADSDGAYAARWKADRPGPARVRARIEGSATAASAAPELAITLYRAQRATWYGPGFYGNETACGQKLTRTLVGVAHKTLRCGTQVEFLYRGRTLTAPVSSSASRAPRSSERCASPKPARRTRGSRPSAR